MLGSDNKPAEENLTAEFRGSSRVWILEFSKKIQHRANVWKSWNETVGESVGNKSAKLYRPYLKLTLYQIKDIYHRKLGTDGIAELNKGSLNYSEQNKPGEGSYGNVYHGYYEGMSTLVKQFGLPSLRRMFLRDLQTIWHDILRSK